MQNGSPMLARKPKEPGASAHELATLTAKELAQNSAPQMDAASLWTDAEEDITQERFEEIKARTMFEMVEEVNGGAQKLLFLTNAQADLLASSDANIKKMLGALELPPAKLLIVLGNDMNLGQAFFRSTHKDSPSMTKAFATPGEWRDAEANLDRFMLEVVLPVAIQTNAIIVCSAIQEMALSAAFLRMASLEQSKFAGGAKPFSVIATVGDIYNFYINPNPSTHWREVRRASKAWRKRDRKFLELLGDDATTSQAPRWDISSDAEILLVVDSINTRKEKSDDQSSYNNLMAALIRHLSSELPAITLRVGGTSSVTSLAAAAGNSLTLLASVEALNSGSPVLFLDVRQREAVQAADRASLIEAAKAAYQKSCDELHAAGTYDALDTSAIAYFHDVLYGDGIDSSTQYTSAFGTDASQPVCIHEAIRLHRQRNNMLGVNTSSDGDHFARATSEQVQELARWFATTYVDNRFRYQTEVSPNGVKLYAKRAADLGLPRCEKELYMSNFGGAGLESTLTLFAKLLLSHEHFHSANVVDVDGSRRLVQTLVKLDRLPKENTLEALELLQMAWAEHDIAMHLSKKYERLSHLLYALNLLIGVAIITFGIIEGRSLALFTVEDVGHSALQHVVFGLSLLSSVVFTANRFYNPSRRGRQLSASAAALESTIWRFRTRVGEFAVPRNQPKAPDSALRVALNSWRDELVGGTDLLQTSLEKKYPAYVHKHCQYAGTLPDMEVLTAHESKAREIAKRTAKVVPRGEKRAVTATGAGVMELSPAEGALRSTCSRLMSLLAFSACACDIPLLRLCARRPRRPRDEPAALPFGGAGLVSSGAAPGGTHGLAPKPGWMSADLNA